MKRMQDHIIEEIERLAKAADLTPLIDYSASNVGRITFMDDTFVVLCALGFNFQTAYCGMTLYPNFGLAGNAVMPDGESRARVVNIGSIEYSSIKLAEALTHVEMMLMTADRNADLA